MSHTYHFPTLWSSRDADEVVTERHDIALLIDATNCNPNGDPDTGNMPRLQPDTLRGLVTDVCLKRKVRNFFSLHTPSGESRAEGDAHDSDDRYAVFIHENAVIQRNLEADAVHQRAKRLFNDELSDNERLHLNGLFDSTFEIKAKSGLKGESKKKADKWKRELTDKRDRSL